jgi:two-component system NtrC family sensor kinase
MKQLIVRLLGGQLQPVLIACFSLVAALTVGLSTVVTLSVITDYLDEAMNNRVARDMDLANAFYQLKLDEIRAVAERMVRDPQVVQNLPAALEGREDARSLIDQEISRKISVPTLGGTHLLLVLDGEGNITLGRVLSQEGELSPPITQGNWSQLPIVATVFMDATALPLSYGEGKSATEIIPADLLAQVGLDEQAQITLIETLKATQEPFDPREGTAGLALISIYPFLDDQGNEVGAVLAAYLFNNDFTLVDRVKEIAGVDTVTVFFGDLRVSTNVLTEDGERAVGTRVSEDVFDVVLEQGQDYVGRAFVVNDWFITRYEPLRDHLGQVVGSLYVGARESTFQKLVQAFSYRVAIIALVSMVLAGIVAVPIARLITRPITALVEANRRLAQGDMTVRVQPYGSGELAELGHSFNKLAETLNSTQQELLHKERLASMGQLAAGVAHEINNPLGTILLFSDMLYKETSRDDPRSKDLKMIVDETNRCKNIVADLLNFSRQQEVLAQDIDVNALISSVIEVVEHQPIFESVNFVKHLAPDLPAIQADPAQLKQVFVNLFNNAAEAKGDGGTITLTTRPIDGSFVEIKVSDTGCGIPEEDLGKLFTPFFTTKALGKGTGLGLSIVYGIIKMHKGQITAQSEVGQGTTFTITLPIKMYKESSTLVGTRVEVLV